MKVTIPLEKMTAEEKIQTMETIWDDLCKNADIISSPGWHENILNERESDINDGKDGFEDWDTARKRIQDSI